MNELHSLHAIIEGRKLNVCAYCRVSSNKDEQETSLIEQIDFYSDLILNNPQWKFVGIYADDGFSGTTIVQRKQFKQMLNKALNGQIDIIITKSISRFARNVTDLLSSIHELRVKGVEVIFERENFSTLDMKSDTMLTIYAKFAEEEAESISRNVKWRKEINKKNGIYFIPTNLFGYTKDKFNKMIINEKEAYWVRKIFLMYLEKIPVKRICQFLEENKVLTPLGNKSWQVSTIRSILRNEKYVGDCLIQKKFVENPLTHKKILNRGEMSQAYISNGHPAIIERDLWDKVQQLIKLRREKFKINNLVECGNEKTKHTSEWTYFAICPYCYKSFGLKTSYSTKRKILIDSSNRDVLTCMDSQTIYVDVLEKAILQQMHILYENLTAFRKAIFDAYEIQKDTFLENKKIELENKISSLQERLIALDQSKESNIELKQELKVKVKELMRELSKIQTQNVNSSIIDNLSTYVSIIKQSKNINDLSDISFRDLFSKMIPVKRNKLIFVIGNFDKSKINIEAKTLFNGTITYKERATIFTCEFGIVIHA